MGGYKMRTGQIWAIAALLVCLLFCSLRWSYLEMPLDRDEGMYLVIGQQLASGAVPYKDVYEMKPPGLFYTYAVLAGLGGYSYEGARIWALVLYALNGVLLFFLLRSRSWTWGAFVAQCVFYALSMNPYLHVFSLLPEPLMLFCFLLGLCALAWFGRYAVALVVGGFLLVWSVWIKQNMAFPLLFVMGWYAYSLWEYKTIQRKQLGYLAMGMIAGPALTLGWILVNSAWADMLYWVWTYPATVYTQAISMEKGVGYLQTFLEVALDHSGLWAVLALIGFGVHFFVRKTAWGSASPLLFFIFSFMAVVPGLRFYGHYWILMLPALAIGVGALWEFAGEMLRSVVSSRLGFVLLGGLFLGVFGYHLRDQDAIYFEPNVEVWSYISYGNNPFSAIRDIAEKLDEYARSDSEVVVMGSEPQLYVYLEQMPFTPHTFIAFLNKQHPRRGAMRAEFTSQVREVKPEYMLFVNHPYSWSITENDHQDVFTWAYRYGKNYYRPIGLYELDANSRDRKLWSDDPGLLQPRAQKYIQILKRK
jgi:hypothetical protein